MACVRRIAIVSDAWTPQVNGVVRTLAAIRNELQARGREVLMVTPEGRRSTPMPFYPEIPLTLAGPSQIAQELTDFRPDAIHLATEGPLGWLARHHCLSEGLSFTTSFHTRFAEYAARRIPLPGIARLGWRALRRFHAPSRAVMVPTASIARELGARGFANVRVWTRGVDPHLFKPWPRDALRLPRPVLLYAGRLAVEKGIEEFLRLDVAGSKVVVGDGPMRASLARAYPHATFTGYRHGEDYARLLAAADVLVFPSRTDTFGLVMIEAMACGTPVAGFDVPSPIDVVEDDVTGALDADLGRAVCRALLLDRETVARAARQFTWQRAADMFESWLAILPQEWTQSTQAPPLLHLR